MNYHLCEVPPHKRGLFIFDDLVACMISLNQLLNFTIIFVLLLYEKQMQLILEFVDSFAAGNRSTNHTGKNGVFKRHKAPYHSC